MNETLHTGVLGDQAWRVRVEHEEGPENPRKTEENLWTLVCAHKRYTLGDHMIKDPQDPQEMKDILAAKDLNRRTALVVPVYMYDHSGLALAITPFSDRWDSGQVGEAFIPYATIKEEFGGKRERALESLKGELKTYEAYLNGEVYGVIYETRPVGDTADRDADDGDEPGEGEWEMGDSCWGYYGEDSAKAGVLDIVPKEVAEIIAPPVETPVIAPKAAKPRRAGPR